MSEIWVIKTFDGEEYPLRTDGVCFYDGTYESIYNLLKETEGHHGIPRTLLSDEIPEIAGEELRQIKEDIRTQYLPLRITGLNSADFHKNMAKLRKSLVNGEAQLWITNEEGDTRILYCNYKSGFDKAIDGSKRGRNWISVPLYLQANDPYFYDQPGVDIDNVYYQEPWTTKFLTNAVSSAIVTQSTYNTTGGTTLWVEDSTGFAADQDIVIISVNTATANYREVQTIASVDVNGHEITIKSGTGSGTLAYTHTEAHYAYISFIDPADHFLNPTPILETTLTDTGTIGDATITIAATALCAAGDHVRIIDPIKNLYEENVIASVTDGNTLTLDTKIVNTYLLANAPLVLVNRRVVNSDCVFVIYWLTGCPPCYRALAQLQALQETYSGLGIVYVEITQANPMVNVVGEICSYSPGMTAALATYPEGYAFAQACGPPLPALYHEIGTVMPAVITLYRSGIFIKGWCGVHTTNVDAVSDAILLDACGNRMKWRLSRTWIGYKVPIDNTGDAIAYPVWTLYGPGRTPRLTNVTTGKQLQLDHDLLEGEVVVVDSRDGAHTCGSNREGGEFIAGYTDSEPCPTCHGIGTIPSTCADCGGTEVCPSCHGTGIISVWIPNSFGTTQLIGDMYNLRNELADTSQSFWGLAPSVNVVEMEMDSTNTTTSKIELQFQKKYEGI